MVKTPACDSCGSEARPHALFCFHCGSALRSGETSDEPLPAKEDRQLSDIWFREDLTEKESGENNHARTPPPPKPNKKKEPKPEPSPEPVAEKTEVPEEKPPEIEKPEVSEPEPVAESEPPQSKAVPADTQLKSDLRSGAGGDAPRTRIRSRATEETKFTSSFDDTRLRSAASLRKKGKPARLKMVEIVWEEKEQSPNIWFMVMALLFGLFAAVLVYLALYLK